VDDTEPGLVMVHLLRRLALDLNLVAARFAQINGLHPTDLQALIHLLDAERAGRCVNPGDLGRALALNSASVTALIDRLERLGHVRRERDDQDRRRVRITIQDEAVSLGWSFFGPLINCMISAMRDFDDDELTTVRRFLTAVHRVVPPIEPEEVRD
jgi:DNA-binding MarR family transcriptional regulator